MKSVTLFKNRLFVELLMPCILFGIIVSFYLLAAGCDPHPGELCDACDKTSDCKDNMTCKTFTYTNTTMTEQLCALPTTTTCW
jgi:hypothetical protein